MRIALLLVAATALRAPARHSATRASVATTRRGGAAAVANATTTTLRGGAIDDKIAAAIDACRAALEKRANNTKAAAALATLLRQTGDEDGALAALARAAAPATRRRQRWAVAPRTAATTRARPGASPGPTRATSRRSKGEGQARAQLAKWTDGDEDWRRAPLDASYVSGLFDQFAKTFEQKLVGDLSYRGHLQCAGLLARSLPKRPGVVAVDVGAGTGLCGAALRDALPIEEIVGADVSPRMLDAAKGVYEDLVVSDGAAYLATRGPGSVDVLVAADVFAYVGDCAELFSAGGVRDAAWLETAE
ncbi:methyltransferase domain-containing protein [Aureococcus anophagefferens]|nr:methyltransferase domain-containing protein [Aureococcus anophagefferens]